MGAEETEFRDEERELGARVDVERLFDDIGAASLARVEVTEAPEITPSAG